MVKLWWWTTGVGKVQVVIERSLYWLSIGLIFSHGVIPAASLLWIPRPFLLSVVGLFMFPYLSTHPWSVCTFYVFLMLKAYDLRRLISCPAYIRWLHTRCKQINHDTQVGEFLKSTQLGSHVSQLVMQYLHGGIRHDNVLMLPCPYDPMVFEIVGTKPTATFPVARRCFHSLSAHHIKLRTTPSCFPDAWLDQVAEWHLNLWRIPPGIRLPPEEHIVKEAPDRFLLMYMNHDTQKFTISGWDLVLSHQGRIQTETEQEDIKIHWELLKICFNGQGAIFYWCPSFPPIHPLPIGL